MSQRVTLYTGDWMKNVVKAKTPDQLVSGDKAIFLVDDFVGTSKGARLGFEVLRVMATLSSLHIWVKPWIDETMCLKIRFDAVTGEGTWMRTKMMDSANKFERALDQLNGLVEKHPDPRNMQLHVNADAIEKLLDASFNCEDEEPPTDPSPSTRAKEDSSVELPDIDPVETEVKSDKPVDILDTSADFDTWMKNLCAALNVPTHMLDEVRKFESEEPGTDEVHGPAKTSGHAQMLYDESLNKLAR
jgi:hypothetical protein